MISEKEFTKGWEKLMLVFLEKSAGSAGVSKLQIIATVLYIVVVLGLLIAFVLMALAAWRTDDSFVASVQSGLVVACGKFGERARRRGKAEGNTEEEGTANMS